MKKILHTSLLFAVTMCTVNSLQAQDVYWREGFEGGEISTVNPTSSTPGPNDYYAAGANSASWYLHNTYRTTGTPCGGVYGAYHLRLLNISNATPADTSYVVLPPVEFGVNQIHFSRCENTGASTNRMSFWVRADTIGNISPITGTGWTKIAVIQPFPNANVDTFVTVPAPLNLSTKRVAISLSQASNADVDSIWLVSATPILPVTFGSVSAAEASGKVRVNWNILTEENTARYEIERSVDGRNFATSGLVEANRSKSYSWTDMSPVRGTNFYRLKAIDKDGSSMFSSVVKVTIGGRVGELAISPNPVKGGRFNLQVANLERGTYTLNVFNTVGQVVFTKTLEFNGGVTSFPLQVPGSVKAGVYNLQLRNGADVITKKLVIE